MKSSTGKFFWSHLPFSIVLPVVISVFLFVLTIFMLLIPYLESTLMEYRRHLIHNLTEVAISTLELYESKEKQGILSQQEAQQLAMEHIRQIRYGTELKDYFWINDLHPNIIMHPYRPDLEGQDVSHFKDPTGKKPFVEMVNAVQGKGSGFVNYEWQWKDNPLQIAPKLSFVREFKPWNWIIGTGIYVNDIKEEIAALTKRLTIICSIIFLTLFLLSSYIILQGIKVEKERLRAEQQSHKQQEQLFQAAKLASLGTLVSGVAHEINNPTTSMLLNAPLLKKMWEGILKNLEQGDLNKQNPVIAGMPFSQVKERIPKLLDHMVEGSKRIKEIVAELKDFARSSPPELNDQVNLNQAAQKAISLVTNVINKHTNRFNVYFAQQIPYFQGNLQKIEQVIINLIVNACQALTDPTQSISLSTSFDSDKKLVILEVEDQGVGIPENVMRQIRDPFFTTKQNQGNTGLGLAISERIIKDHQGVMEIQSEINSGTTVQLKFPHNLTS